MLKLMQTLGQEDNSEHCVNILHETFYLSKSNWPENLVLVTNLHFYFATERSYVAYNGHPL